MTPIPRAWRIVASARRTMGVGLVALAVASPVRAEPTSPPPSRDETQRASEAFRAAVAAFSDEDYPEALRLFRSALTLAPNDNVRFNVAVCLERLGRFREAGVEYEAAAASAALTHEIRARAQAEAARVRARLGQLSVTGRPAGAAVQIDGLALCALPCRIEIDPGRHEVVVETRDASDRGVVQVARGEVSTLTLEAVPARPVTRGLGALAWAGAGATALGTGAAIYFGLRARSLHDDYVAMPTVDRREDGLRMKDLTNLSIGVAALGAIAVAVDVFVLSRRPAAAARRLRPTTAGLEIVF